MNGTINQANVKAREVVYDGKKSYLRKTCEVQTDTHLYRWHEFELKEEATFSH